MYKLESLLSSDDMDMPRNNEMLKMMYSVIQGGIAEMRIAVA